MAESDKPWELVNDPRYFAGVLKNLVSLGFGPKKDGKAFVRFGNMGGGYAPNYQVQTDDGNIHCFGGRNHKARAEDQFDTENLSEDAFSYADVTKMLSRLRGR